jgi:hypothetical protein
MTTVKQFVFLLLCSALPLSASLLSVSSSVTEPAGSLTPVSDSESVTSTFTFLATGGTGSAYWLPDLELNGSGNESDGRDLEIGGTVTSTWPFSTDVGDSAPGGSGNQSPFFACEAWDCEIPFTYGVEQTFTITLTASSVIEPNPGAPLYPWDQTVMTSGYFNGVLNFSSCPEQLCLIIPPTYDLEQLSSESSDPSPTSVPEPDTWINVTSALVLICFSRFSRMRKPLSLCGARTPAQCHLVLLEARTKGAEAVDKS